MNTAVTARTGDTGSAKLSSEREMTRMPTSRRRGEGKAAAVTVFLHRASSAGDDVGGNPSNLCRPAPLPFGRRLVFAPEAPNYRCVAAPSSAGVTARYAP